MTKIKNFKITLRPRDIARWLKKERGIETTPDLELLIEQGCKEAKPWIEPAAIYTTLTRPIAEKTTSIAFAGKTMAVSIVAVSIGPALEKERQAAQADPSREPLLSALLQESLTQTLQFAIRLLQDQAKEEDCELTPPTLSTDAAMSGSLATLVGIQRIGIELDSSTSEFPPHARLAYMFWTPVGKGASRRLEKAVA